MTHKIPAETALSILNFCYFMANYPNDFIQKAFPDQYQHLYKKFHHYVAAENTGYCNFNAFMNFFFSLDGQNREILLNWIDSNYHYCTMHRHVKDIQNQKYISKKEKV